MRRAVARASSRVVSIALPYASVPCVASENQNGSPRARRDEVEGVVGRVPVGAGLQHIEVRSVLRVRLPREVGVAVEQRGTVEWREEPLVRIDRQGVRSVDPAEQGSRARRPPGPQARMRRRRATTSPFAAATSAIPMRSSTIPAFVVPAVATIANTPLRSVPATVCPIVHRVRRPRSSVGATSIDASMTRAAAATDECAASLTTITERGASSGAIP